MVAAGHARDGVRAEEKRKRDRSGGRGNGKSARYYAPLTLPEKEDEDIEERGTRSLHSLVSALRESYAPSDTLMFRKKSICFIPKQREINFLRSTS